MQNVQEKAKNVGCTCINPTPDARILHPILHPKLSANTGHLAPWCRKCRRFSKTFFVERREGRMRCSGPETAKHRTSLGKSTDVLPQKYGCFHRRSPMFLFSGKDIPHHKQVPSSSWGTWMPSRWVGILESGVDDAGPCTFAHGYLIFKPSQS